MSKLRPAPLLDVDQVTVPAFGLCDELAPGAGHWHAHRLHQVLYASDGAVRLELDDARWLLPPARAAWIAAGTRHCIDVVAQAELRTVYFEPGLSAASVALAGCGVFGVGPLAREMIVQGAAWGPDVAGDPRHAEVCLAFFRALAALVGWWLEAALPFVLPRATSPELRRATKHLLDHLDEPLDARALAKVAAVSTRTLTRRFHAETGLAPRVWLHQARMLHAMELLAAPRASVTEAALAAGFSSLPTFSRQFAAFTGQTPRAYRANGRASAAG